MSDGALEPQLDDAMNNTSLQFGDSDANNDVFASMLPDDYSSRQFLHDSASYVSVTEAGLTESFVTTSVDGLGNFHVSVGRDDGTGSLLGGAGSPSGLLDDETAMAIVVSMATDHHDMISVAPLPSLDAAFDALPQLSAAEQLDLVNAASPVEDTVKNEVDNQVDFDLTNVSVDHSNATSGVEMSSQESSPQTTPLMISMEPNGSPAPTHMDLSEEMDLETDSKSTQPNARRGPRSRVPVIPKPKRKMVKATDGKYHCTYEGCTDLIRSWKRKCEFSKHMDKHERPYRCVHPTCDKLAGFTYSGGLIRHEREVHNQHGGPKKAVMCPHVSCKRHTGKGFSRMENLNEHLRRVHTSQGGYVGSPSDEVTTPSDDGLSASHKSSTGHSGSTSEEMNDLREEIKRLRNENQSLQLRQEQMLMYIRQLGNAMQLDRRVDRLFGATKAQAAISGVSREAPNGVTTAE